MTTDAPVDSMGEPIDGRDTFEKLVREFYVGVATDEVLLPMYPEQPDLEGAIQRLRQRHMPFTVNPAARDRWLHHMRAALDTLDTLELPPLYDAEIWAYLDRAAHAMVNTFEDWA